MKRNPVPSYLLHRQSGRARAVWTDPSGKRREQLLAGPFNSSESRAAYARLVAEHAVAPAAVPLSTNGLSVSELLLAYITFARRYYVNADGEPSKEFVCMKYAIKPVCELFGATLAIDFGPLALKTVRQHMINAGLCRTEVNHRVNRIKRVFKWAVSEQLLPVTNLEALRALAGLRRGRSEAREPEPVKSISEAVVMATLPHLPPHVRAIVELMLHTGMRPSEVCEMKLSLINQSGETWLYRPASHKTAHHGKDRVVPLGPQARLVLAGFLRGRSLTPDEYLFSPRRQREERFAAMRAVRKSRVQPSQQHRKRANPKKLPGEKYKQDAVTWAVASACKAQGLEHWHPYQLRHAFASKVRKAHGLEAAQVLLGHSHANVTEIYAERNVRLAMEVAAKIG